MAVKQVLLLVVQLYNINFVSSKNTTLKQEAQLSPRDCAMRRVNWNLANCHATVQKLRIQVLTKSMVWSWRFSRRQCVIDNVHLTMTQPSRLPLSQVSYTNRPQTSCVYHLYTHDLLWQNFLSPQCRNCSRDPDHAHLGSTHLSQDYDFTWPTRVQNLKSLALAFAEILRGV